MSSMANLPEDRPAPEISVRVFGMDAADKPFSRTAHAFQISGTSARLRGVDVALRVGDIVGVQSDAAKARFRVAGITEGGNAQSGQIEVVCIDAGQNIWTCSTAAQPSPVVKADLPRRATPGDSEIVVDPQPSRPPTKRERRRFERYKCDIGALVACEGDKRLWARCSDVSFGGCYLETWSPLPLGANFHLELDGIAITAAVSTCHPNVGMGVRFVNVAVPQRLQALIEKLRHSD
jgi:hypothetical protein